MSVLLEDLAEEATASNRRTADRLDAEASDLRLKEQQAAGPHLWQRAVESARQATDYALARSAEAAGLWESALASLRPAANGSDAERMLQTHHDLLESALRILRASLTLWSVPQRQGIAPERIDELAQTEQRIAGFLVEAKKAIEHRARERLPVDPERLAAGLKLAREGKTINADEARNRFRNAQG